MYLKPTEEEEIIKIVTKWKNKKSTDWNDIDLTLIKEILGAIVKKNLNIGKIVNRLEHFMEKHELLVDCQYGFSNRSTSMALMKTLLVDKKKYAVGVFIAKNKNKNF